MKKTKTCLKILLEDCEIVESKNIDKNLQNVLNCSKHKTKRSINFL